MVILRWGCALIRVYGLRICDLITNCHGICVKVEVWGDFFFEVRKSLNL